ncbi:2-oxo acid dehydrogenase subunit E2 [Streptomyces mirabilis]|uniref:2-oxo acid dehydrogenase subunit E2 n=1 Tax=Streptomyces mirabilis TaxID=68239 RepID=UPI0036E4390D
MASTDDVILVPHTTIRRRIARHMAASSSAAPHAYAMTDVDYSAVDMARRAHAARWRQELGYSLTYLPFVARAVAVGIEQYQQLNARYTDGGLELRSDVGLGVAVDLNFEGLIVPVVRQANTLSVPALAQAINGLAGRTRDGKLRGTDVTGGTFTLSNPGPFGARTTLPIINQPQVAIITVDAIASRPAVVPDGEGGQALAIRPIGNLTLAWDHRAFDGAYAASALRAIRTVLESHDWRPEFDSWSLAAQDESVASPAA